MTGLYILEERSDSPVFHLKSDMNWRKTVVVIVLTIVTTASYCLQPVPHASAAAYNPLKAIQYAEQWWNKRNSKFQHYGFNDCANFVSQCLIAGGLNLRSHASTDKSGSIAQCDSLDKYLTAFLKATVWKKSQGQAVPKGLQPGDIAIFGNWWGLRHAVFVVAKQSNDQPLFDAHTFDRHKTTLDWLFTAWTYVKYYHIVKSPVIATVAAKPKTPAKTAAKTVTSSPASTKLTAVAVTNVTTRSSTPAVTTSAPSSNQDVRAVTSAATQETATGATLNGVIRPDGTPIRWFFEYGTSETYDMATDQQGPLPCNTTYNISTAVNGLKSGTVYHMRLVIVRPNETLIVGNDMTFTTLEPSRSPVRQD